MVLVFACAVGLFCIVQVIFSIINIRMRKRLINEISDILSEQAEGYSKQLSQQIGLIQTGINHNIQSIIISQQNSLDRVYKQISEGYKINEEKLDKVRDTVEEKLKHMQEGNEQKLEKMRLTVEEKLHDTLEKRIGASFQIVSERLEMVYKGLGEMQNLASGVGDLKRVLSNVKTRGMWGEVQLGNILKQILTSDQYVENVAIHARSQDRVEYAIKLPGNHTNIGGGVRAHSNDNGDFVLLPVDAKLPLEDYEKLTDAMESGDKEKIEECSKLFQASIKKAAKLISTKYIYPPITTDFAIMFLPIEGMYAEVLRHPGLVDTMQRELRIIITGPTTLTALLNSLQIGFKTLIIEKRSSEVWQTLITIKREFVRFADMLSKTKIKLEQAGKAISEAENKTKVINKKLGKLESYELTDCKDDLVSNDNEGVANDLQYSLESNELLNINKK